MPTALLPVLLLVGISVAHAGDAPPVPAAISPEAQQFYRDMKPRAAALTTRATP